MLGLLLFSRAETKRVLCFRPLVQRQKQSLPATKPSQVGWLRWEWRSLIGRPITLTGDSSVPVWKQQCKATLVLKGKLRMEGYKGRRRETEEGGRASESINTRTIYGPSTICSSLLKGRCKPPLAFLYMREKNKSRGCEGVGFYGHFWQQKPHFATVCTSIFLFYCVKDI